MTTEMAVTTARGRLSEVVDRVRRTHSAIALTRNGRRAAVLVDPEEYDRMVAALEAAEEAAEVAVFDEAKAADGGVRVPMAELFTGELYSASTYDDHRSTLGTRCVSAAPHRSSKEPSEPAHHFTAGQALKGGGGRVRCGRST